MIERGIVCLTYTWFLNEVVMYGRWPGSKFTQYILWIDSLSLLLDNTELCFMNYFLCN